MYTFEMYIAHGNYGYHDVKVLKSGETIESVLPGKIEEDEIIFDENENIEYAPMTSYSKDTDTLYFVYNPMYPDNKPVIKHNGEVIMTLDIEKEKFVPVEK